MSFSSFKQMMVIDLTHEIRESTPVYPGDPDVLRQCVYTLEDDGYAVDAWRIGTHVGTHIDAAVHMLKGQDALGLSQYPLTCFEGPARVVPVKEGQSEIAVEAVREAFSGACSVDWIIVSTGWEKYWNEPNTYFMGRYPILTPEAIEFLVNAKLKGIALDLPGPDPYGQDTEIHRELLGHGLLIVENLANVDLLPVNRDLWFSVWPLKLASGDAAPVRAIARF